MIQNRFFLIILLSSIVLVGSCGGGNGANDDTGSSHPNFLTPLGEKLLFIASEKNEYHNPSLWITDGTEANTIKLKNDVKFPDTIDKSKPMVSIGNTVFFLVPDAQRKSKLWSTDGTEPGTRLFSDKVISGDLFLTGHDDLFLTSDDKIFFVVEAGGNMLELWQSDEFGSVFELIQTVGPDQRIELSSTNANELYYFLSDWPCVPDECSALWKTDGTPAGTTLVQDGLDPAFSDRFPGFVNGLYYFFTKGGLHNASVALWVSDGTASGTRVLKMDSGYVDGFGAPISIGWTSKPINMIEFNDETYFLFIHALWKTDGTDEGTIIVKNFPSSNPFNFEPLVATSDSLYFLDPENRLWKSDGTEIGTVRVNLLAQQLGGRTYALVAANNLLYFKKDDRYRFNLLKTDGTDQGMELVVSMIANSGADEYYTPSNAKVAIGNKLFFTANEGGDGEELWVSNGTTIGTYLIKNINLEPPPVDD